MPSVSAFDRRATRDLHRGFSDSLGRGVELTCALAVMTLIGWMVDGWLGTRPLCTLIAAALGAGGVGAKLWIGYDRDMRAIEATAPWSRDRAPRPPQDTP